MIECIGISIKVEGKRKRRKLKDAAFFSPLRPLGERGEGRQAGRQEADQTASKRESLVPL